MSGKLKAFDKALRGLGLLGKKPVTNLQHPVLDRLKIKKNLTGRRTDRDSIIKGVDKHLKSSNPKSSPIKKKFTDKASAIHDKYEKTNLTANQIKASSRRIEKGVEKRNEESKKMFKKAKGE